MSKKQQLTSEQLLTEILAELKQIHIALNTQGRAIRILQEKAEILSEVHFRNAYTLALSAFSRAFPEAVQEPVPQTEPIPPLTPGEEKALLKELSIEEGRARYLRQKGWVEEKGLWRVPDMADEVPELEELRDSPNWQTLEEAWDTQDEWEVTRQYH